jgi:hypothetical protein
MVETSTSSFLMPPKSGPSHTHVCIRVGYLRVVRVPNNKQTRTLLELVIIPKGVKRIGTRPLFQLVPYAYLAETLSNFATLESSNKCPPHTNTEPASWSLKCFHMRATRLLVVKSRVVP